MHATYDDPVMRVWHAGILAVSATLLAGCGLLPFGSSSSSPSPSPTETMPSAACATGDSVTPPDISDFTIAPNPSGPAQIMKIDLKYSDDRKRTISGIKRVSTPGLRVYRAATDVPRVLGGLGVAVLSTSQGLMTDREARKRNVGGEVMCFVW